MENEKYTLGIDDSHSAITYLIHKLKENREQGQSKEAFTKVFRRLMEYFVVHFTEEEFFMGIKNIDDITKHKKEHRKFEKKLFEFHQKLIHTEKVDMIEMIMEIEHWHFEHILTFDQYLITND